MHGIAPDDFTGTFEALLELIHPDDRDPFSTAVDLALATCDDFQHVFRVATQYGQVRWIEGRGRVLCDAAGQATRMMGIGLDVTERETFAAEQQFLAAASSALAASLDIRKTLQQVADLGIPILGDWCLIHLLNAQGELECVAVAHPPLPVHLANYRFDPCYPPNADAAIGPYRVLRTGEPELTEAISAELIAALMADPEDIPMVTGLSLASMLVVPLTARRRVIGTISYFTSVSRRPLAAADLTLASRLAVRAAYAIDNANLFNQVRAIQERFRTVFESVGDAIVIFDEEGRILEANEALVRLLGLKPESLPSFHLADLGFEPDSLRLDRLSAECEESGSLGEFLLRRPDGSAVPVEARVTRVETADGPVHVGVLRDISDRRDLEQFRQDFLAMVTHDLRSPLAALKLNAQLLERRETYDPATVRNIVTQVDRITRLSEDLADVVRIESGRLKLNIAPADLMSVAKLAVESIQSRYDNHPVVFEEPDGQVIAPVDVNRLAQIVQNLVDNAMKYSDTRDPVIVTVGKTAEHAVIRIVDRGTGIPPAQRTQLFQRYSSGDPENADGHGLGLYIVRMLTELHQGTVEVESEVGVGTAMTIRFPLKRRT